MAADVETIFCGHTLDDKVHLDAVPDYVLVEFTGYGPWVLFRVFMGVGLLALL
jgi:hypothetical protein